MASALLASRNEPYYWGGEPKVVCMRKAPPNPYPNPSPKIPNHNPNPSLVTHARIPLNTDEFPSAAASDGSSSLGMGPRKEPLGSYRTFNISACSRKELRDLKRLLVKELELVRSVASRIESRDPQQRPGRGPGPNHVPAPAAPSPRGQPKRPSMESDKLLASMMKKCGQILTKLMKHKGGVWFNTPVDVDGMGLHDYHQIVKNPMDLGTVKTKHNKGLYPSPSEFAADIRLTFKNALLYNPEGHDVNTLAGQLLKLFEGMFYPAFDKYEKQQSVLSREEGHQRGSSRASLMAPSDSAVRAQSSVPMVPLLQPPPPPPAPKPSAPAPVYPRQQPQPPPPQMQPVAPRLLTGKQPKPKAKEPNKRPMSLEEKQKLSVGLQSLPEEKMEQVLQIVKRRNVDPAQHGDEIELDFEMMDTETLWELDRFVCNCKKAISKIKRQEALAGGSMAYSIAPSSAQTGSKSPTMGSDTHEATASKKIKRGEPGDEDVDIVDDMPSTHYPPVEIEKDVGVASSSSSSGSDSSSSSGSDSGSSSGSDSDGDEAQSPAVGSRPSPRN